MTAAPWHEWFTYRPEDDPAVVRERETIAVLREHAEALRTFGTPRRRKPPAPATAHPVSELDRAAAQREVLARARKLGMVVRDKRAR